MCRRRGLGAVVEGTEVGIALSLAVAVHREEEEWDKLFHSRTETQELVPFEIFSPAMFRAAVSLPIRDPQPRLSPDTEVGLERLTL